MMQGSRTQDYSVARIQDCRSRTSRSLARARLIPAIVMEIKWNTMRAIWVTRCTGVVTSPIRYLGNSREGRNGWNLISRRTPKRHY